MRLFTKDLPVHITSRAIVDIFTAKDDCYRFIFQFYAANFGRRGFNVDVKDAIKAGRALLKGEKIPQKFIVEKHPPLVHLLDFSLVVNHYHFYLSPTADNAVPVLMRKLNDGFAKSFNLLRDRKGAVFGSRYKGVIVENEFQSHAVSRYVSIINPLDVFQPKWRESGLKNKKRAFEFLMNYPFSSFPDRIKKRFSRILAPEEIMERYAPFWENKNEYQGFVEEFLNERVNDFYQHLE